MHERNGRAKSRGDTNGDGDLSQREREKEGGGQGDGGRVIGEEGGRRRERKR